ncbi:glycoside hydrolase family 88 protein [Pedobacter aquatilis]|uniref:glycoside hydrolase family 88/105 protein n=1 Tax=Pedobacter aquatilis TaxID=351343 RepID=UPI00292F4EB3|nr:glycoside hydrolase family 88 protein [Pedobacter aquatilis]
MKKVADWQVKTWKDKGFNHRKADWTNATCYTGLYALGTIKGNEKYLKTLENIGNDLGWNTGHIRFYADDYCVAQMYGQLYLKYKEKKMIAPFILLADSILARPHDEPLNWKNNIQNREWAWCDALFMGPPALAYLSSATGNLKYLDMASRLWWKTTDFLYDPTEQLYFRDETYLNKKEKNGAKVFWSRGNGWVLGGLVRMMENMPANYPEKERFQKLYKDMMLKIASLQQADGSWHASLLDPESFPIREMSGTGFYCYAAIWGLNHGLLDKKTFLPVVKKSWEVLNTSVLPDGKLGYVQPIGASPDKVEATSTEVYGVGAYLLAGAELNKYVKKNSKDFRN